MANLEFFPYLLLWFKFIIWFSLLMSLKENSLAWSATLRHIKGFHSGIPGYMDIRN
jgi:hypothetical protein